MSNNSKLVKPNNTLKKKVGHGGFKESDLMKAQSMIENNKIDFKPIAEDFVKDIGEILDQISSGTIEGKDALGSVMYPIMQLRAQGALFHYPVITNVSDIIVDFVDGVGLLDADVIEIIVAYKNAIAAILKLGIKDASNKAGQQISSELRAACLRYKKSKNI